MKRQTNMKTGLPILFASILYGPVADVSAQTSSFAATVKEVARKAFQGDGEENQGIANSALSNDATVGRGEGKGARATRGTTPKDSKIVNRYETGKTRYVHANRAFSRSGPGDNHYPTSLLKTGAAVDVYLETSDGWSAVRPTLESHNWIPASAAYLLPGGESAEVTEDGVPAWVGTDLDQPKQLHWQSTLAQGQIVRVLGERLQQSAKNGETSQTLWYKIAPPQGEFRWVRTALLSSEQVTAPGDVMQIAAQDAGGNSGQSGVRLANAEVIQSELAVGDGEIVWSDEAEVLSDINRQIRIEQNNINQTLPPGAVQGIVSEGYVGELDEEFYGEVASDGYPISVDEAMTPQDLKRAKRHQNAQHQVDSLRHWDSLEGSDPKLKLKPLASVLGLIGFGVVETQRVPNAVGAPIVAGGSNAHLPINSQIAIERNQFPQGQLAVGQSLQNLQNPTGSRLDRLPRPGRSAKVTAPVAGRDPLHGIGPNAADLSNSGLGQGIGLASNPIDPNKPVLSRLWNSDQPLFGPDVANLSGTLAANQHSPQPLMQQPYPWQAIGGQNGLAPNAVSPMHSYPTPGMGVPPSLAYSQQIAATSADPQWHADQNASTQVTSHLMQEAFADPLAEAEFETPEIQMAMLDLTRIVAQPTEAWNLNHLRDQCQRWIDQGGSSLVRGEARLLLERVDRFDALRTRTLGTVLDPSRIASNAQQVGGGAVPNTAFSSVPVQFASSSNQLGAPGPNSASLGNTAAWAGQIGSVNQASAHGVPGVGDANARAGDASGWLVQVHGAMPGQPEFALTDDQGKVVTYVQTTAALNIRRYLQQPVIIYGQRGYIPNLAARQITVEKIARLR